MFQLIRLLQQPIGMIELIDHLIDLILTQFIIKTLQVVD